MRGIASYSIRRALLIASVGLTFALSAAPAQACDYADAIGGTHSNGAATTQAQGCPVGQPAGGGSGHRIG
jgi:hypothetical protein